MKNDAFYDRGKGGDLVVMYNHYIEQHGWKKTTRSDSPLLYEIKGCRKTSEIS